MVKSFFSLILLYSAIANALIGVQNLENKLFEQNSELSFLQKQVEAKEALYSSSKSSFLPTINAVGGWQSNKTDANAQTEKGTVGYLEARYNLFNGFKDKSTLNQKEVDLNLSKYEYELKQRDLRISLTEIISEMLYLHKLQDILVDEYKAVQAQKRMAQKKVAAGLTGPVDNLEFSLRESEIEIEQNQINQLHDEAHQKLTKLFGAELTDSEFAAIKYQSHSELTKFNTTFDHLKNVEYKIAEQNITKATFQKSESRSDFLPKLDLTASVGRLTPSETTPTQYNESKYGITLTIPLFSGLDTYYKFKASNFNISSAEKSLAQVSNNIKSEYNIIKNKIIELGKLFQINEKKLITSQNYFNLTLGEYRRGIKNSPDLVGATERLFSVRKKQVEILKDLETLKIKIDTL
ncbi:MAG: TolC family protein [Pseudobdellovibrio sp.]